MRTSPVMTTEDGPERGSWVPRDPAAALAHVGVDDYLGIQAIDWNQDPAELPERLVVQLWQLRNTALAAAHARELGLARPEATFSDAFEVWEAENYLVYDRTVAALSLWMLMCWMATHLERYGSAALTALEREIAQKLVDVEVARSHSVFGPAGPVGLPES